MFLIPERLRGSTDHSSEVITTYQLFLSFAMSLPSSSTPSSPSRSRTPIPRPPSSPLRPTSPLASRSPPTTSRRISEPSAGGSLSSTPPGERPKTRARDLLRKHYGLGIGLPPPAPGRSDPMDLGMLMFVIAQ